MTRTATSGAPSGAVLVFLLAAALLAAGTGSGEAAAITDIATDATDPSNLADTEPSIAVDPFDSRRIAIVTFSEQWGPQQMAPVWKSDDSGASWRKVRQIPQPAPGLIGPGDQKVAFDATGRLFIAELGSDFNGARDFVFQQLGGPDEPLTAGFAYGDDQPHLEVGISAGPCQTRLYSPWLNFMPSHEPSMDRTSINGGTSGRDIEVGDNSSFPNRTTRIALAPDGSAYIIYKTREGAVSVSLPGSTNSDFENAHFHVHRSDDCGQTWSALGTTGVSVHGSDPVQTFFTTNFGNKAKGKVARARSSDAWIAVNPTNGDVYAVYVNRDASGFGQIYVARSSDKGLNWTSRRLTDATHHSAFPEIAVTANGTVGVLYIDFDDSGPSTTFRHRFARSDDSGATWTDEVLQTMDPGPLANAADGFLWGDYEGLTAAGNTFYGVFTGQSVGRTTPQLDPIFFKEDVQELAKLTIFKELVHPDQNHLRLFNLQIDGSTVKRNINSGSTGPKTVIPGSHKVGETGGTGTFLPGFTSVIGGDCAADGTIKLGPGDSRTCTITNFDHSGGCAFQHFCCVPGDGTQGCQLCRPLGGECP